jgi:hypothetical protein
MFERHAATLSLELCSMHALCTEFIIGRFGMRPRSICWSIASFATVRKNAIADWFPRHFFFQSNAS